MTVLSSTQEWPTKARLTRVEAFGINVVQDVELSVAEIIGNAGQVFCTSKGRWPEYIMLGPNAKDRFLKEINGQLFTKTWKHYGDVKEEFQNMEIIDTIKEGIILA